MLVLAPTLSPSCSQCPVCMSQVEWVPKRFGKNVLDASILVILAFQLKSSAHSSIYPKIEYSQGSLVGTLAGKAGFIYRLGTR